MKNMTRAFCLLSACGVAGTVATGAVFQPGPSPAPPEAVPASPPRRQLPRRAPQSPPVALPLEPQGTQELRAEGQRYVYGQVFRKSFTHRSGDPWPVKQRERGLVRSQIADPRPIPPLRVRYAVVSLTAQETLQDRARASHPELFRISFEIFNKGIDATLDRDGQEVLAEMGRQYPGARFRLDYTGEAVPAPEGTWSKEHNGRGVDRSEIFLGHDGAIFDAGLLTTGEMAVQVETSGSIARHAADGWHGGGSGGGTPTRVLGRTYKVCATGPGGREWPSSHLLLVCFVPSQSRREQPRIPEAVYKAAETMPPPEVLETRKRQNLLLMERLRAGQILPPPAGTASPVTGI